MTFKTILTLTLVASMVSPCAANPVKLRDAKAALPTMRWDSRPEAAKWTLAALTVVAAHDDQLANTVPGDIETFCPGYDTASISERRAFWVGLLSATAKHESGFNPAAVGGGGRYIGLMQISPRTAQHYDCDAASTKGLKNGAENLACAIQIMAPHVAADGMVAGKGNKGIARDWGPFSKKSARAEIAGWTAKQPYCQG